MLNAALLENDIYSSGTKKKSKGSTIYERNKVKQNFGKKCFLYEAILDKVMYFVIYSNMISNMEMIVH